MLKKILKNTLKVLMWIVISVFALLLVAVIALQFPQTQKFLTSKAVVFLENKIKTRVEVGGVNVAFPKSVVLKDIYIEDQKKDTLLYGHRIAVDIDLLGLINKKVEVNNIELEKITGHVERTMPDSAFNFDFIVKAFASDSTQKKEEDTTKSNMDIKVMGLHLQDIYLTYKDEVSGTDAFIKLGEFGVDMDEFDLNKKKFLIDEVQFHNTVASLIQTKLPKSTENPNKEPLDLNLGLGELDFSSIKLTYDNRVNKQTINLKLGELNLTANTIDLVNQNIDLDKLELNNTSINYVQGRSVIKDTLVHEKVAKKVEREVKQEAQESGKPWSLNLNSLKMVSNNLKFDDFNAAAQNEGMDFKHLKVEGLAMNVEDVKYSGQDISAGINQFIFREKSGFRIDNFQTNLRVDSTSAKLEDLDLKTGYTHLQNHLEIGFASLDQIADHLSDLKLKVNLEECEIGFQDILFFQPALSKTPPFKGNEHIVLHLDGALNGSVGNLFIPSFQLSALGSTVLKASGHIKGLPEMEKAFIDMKVTRLSSSAKDINDFLPAGMLPSSIRIPADIAITADFKGYLKDFDAEAKVNTSFGDILANINMSPPRNGKEVYKAKVDVNQLQLGKLLKNDSLYGPVSLTASLDGEGLSPETIIANLQAHVKKAVFKKYTYQNLTVDGKIIHKEFDGRINYSDSNLVFAFNGDLNFNKEAPKYKFTLDLKGADFKGLNLTNDDVRLKTKIQADIVGSDLNDVNGDLKINETLVIKNGRNYNVQSFLFASINDKRRTDIKIESDIIDAAFKGTINLGDLSTTLKQQFNRYFALNDTSIHRSTEEENFNFKIDIKNSDLITQVLVPGLTRFRPGEINGKFNSATNNLELRMNVPEVRYNNISIKDFDFNVGSDQNKMEYRLAIESIMQDSTEIKNIALAGDIKDNTISTALRISDDKDKEKFIIGGLLQSVQKAFRFKFDQVVLNYDRWSVNEDNYLQFGGDKFFANNVKLSKGQQYLLLNTINRKEKVPDFQISLNDFHLDFITDLAEKQALALGGAIDGNVVLEKFPGGGSFTSDLKIRDFSFKKDTLGNIFLLANNRVKNQYDVNLKIEGAGNQVNLDGYYLAEKEESALNFDVNIAKLRLASIEPYTAGQATKMSGILTGNIKLAGSTSSPSIHGGLTFREAGFNVTYLKSYFLLDNESIKFDNKGIHFNGFDIKDEKNNMATIDGSVLTTDFKDFGLQLDLSMNHFRVLNTTEDDNDLFYGTVLLDSRVKVRGNAKNPKVEARVKLEKATNFTFAIPPSDPSKDTGKGVYEFVDYTHKVNPIVKRETKKDTIHSEITGINLTAAIDLDKDAQFNIVIDKERGDILNLKGSTNEMVFAMDESGKITLSGRYTVNEGNYKLSFYNLVNRNFALKKGSTLVWSGEPLDAQLNLSAIYTVRTSSSNLMNGAQDAMYKQRLPYEVFLNMKGPLMSPEVSFDIKLPEEMASQYEAINGRLSVLNQNESEKNQQVFALIILGGFIADNSLSTGNPGGLEASARGSVSQILTQQLNKLSDKYVKGVDINVGVNSYQDYSSGSGKNRTDVNVGLSKQLFNERMEVQVGSTINVEGGNQQQQTAGNIVGDMAILYRLTDDGRYKFKAFRQSDYDQTMQGNVIKTGVSLVFLREYNRLRELFKKSEEEEELQIIEENGKAK